MPNQNTKILKLFAVFQDPARIHARNENKKVTFQCLLRHDITIM